MKWTSKTVTQKAVTRVPPRKNHKRPRGNSGSAEKIGTIRNRKDSEPDHYSSSADGQEMDTPPSLRLTSTPKEGKRSSTQEELQNDPSATAQQVRQGWLLPSEHTVIRSNTACASFVAVTKRKTVRIKRGPSATHA